MSVVKTEGLTKSYGGRPPALRDVDLDIAEGVTGLLGPNGAGKSTWMQCVLGLLPDYEGRATVLGMDARQQRKEVRRKVGFMPEADAYLPLLTGLRAVRLLGQLTGMSYREALRRAHEVLHHVGLGEAIFRNVREYSTGMRQRFKLAQALVHDPVLLFLDEPLAGLDPKGREELLLLIRDLADNHGKHIVWSSHLLPDVQRVADSVAVMQDGQSLGVFALDDLAPLEGVFIVEAEGAQEALATAMTNAGYSVEKHKAEGDKLTSVAWTVTIPVADGPKRLFEIAGTVGATLRSVRPVVEDLEDLFTRVLDAGGA